MHRGWRRAFRVGRATRMSCIAVLLLVLSSTSPHLLRAAGPVPEELPLPSLEVFHRTGQTFVTWVEVGGPEVTYNVYRAGTPITAGNFDQAELVATGIPQGTARNFVAENVARFWKQSVAKDLNFTVVQNGLPLGRGTGLFVYTVSVSRTSFYALTAVWPEAGEDRRVKVGTNAQLRHVMESVVPTGPILVKEEKEAQHRRLDYLHWATPEQASVDGHPYGFRVVKPVKPSSPTSPEDGSEGRRPGLIVRLHPYTGNYTQAKWARPDFYTLGLDDFTPAVPEKYHHSFWFGYRENLGCCYLTGEYARRAAGACTPPGERTDPVPVRDYTQKRILWAIQGVAKYFDVDRDRVYLTGSSMGGTGTVGFGLRHPGLFAALDATVPLVNPPRSKAWAYQLLGTIWEDENWPQLPDGEGRTLGERLDDTAYVLGAQGDLPFLRFVNGRRDGAIGWTQIPEFIRALQQARQPFMCAWHNGEHRGAREEEHKAFTSFDVYRIRRDQCVPALADASTADDPGSGDPAEGDLVGAINDDFRWSVEKDSETELALRLWRVPKPGKFAEVTEATVDVTPRRRQVFRPAAGTQVTLRNLSAADGSVLQEQTITVEPSGLLTARQVRVGLEPGSRLVFARSGGGN